MSWQIPYKAKPDVNRYLRASLREFPTNWDWQTCYLKGSAKSVVDILPPMKVIFFAVSVIALALVGEAASAQSELTPEMTVSSPSNIVYLFGVLTASPIVLLLPPYRRSKLYCAVCRWRSQLQLRI